MKNKGIDYQDLSTELDQIYYKDGKGLLSLLNIFDHDIRKLRELSEKEQTPFPIYALKGRLKSHDSLFLKLKKDKNTKINEVTDLLGLRAYCLSNSDIDDAHLELIKYFIRKRFIVTEINIYTSWGDTRTSAFIAVINEEFKKKSNTSAFRAYPSSGITNSISYTYIDSKSKTKNKLNIKRFEKASGYRSVHYVFKGPSDNKLLKEIKSELQLRTILQDVWAEIEHHVKYKKGSTHPHLDKLFHNLSSSLESAEAQIDTIRDITRLYSLWDKQISTIPITIYLHYDPILMKKINSTLKKNPTAKRHYDDYITNVHSPEMRRSNKQSIEAAKNLLSELSKELNSDDMSYFMTMEDAFLELVSGNRERAKQKYKDYIDSSTTAAEKYAVLFRLGEIEFDNQNIVNAFKYFDRCETVMENTKGGAHPINQVSVYQRLANIYWKLGIQYIELSLDRINKAYKVYQKSKAMIDKEAPQVKYSISNNICWYNMEKSIIKIDSLERLLQIKGEDSISDSKLDDLEECLMDAETHYQDLKLAIEEKNNTSVNHNSYDTLGWFCYQKSRCTELTWRSERISSSEAEKRRLRYIDEAIYWYTNLLNDTRNINQALSPLISSQLHKQHFQTVLDAKENRIIRKTNQL